jgi:OOP family OmpA-OmpF porin
MKKAVLPLLLLCLSTGLKAQEATTTENSATEKPAQDYNKWTLELGGGINTAANPLSPGYDISSFNFFSANFSARYMFNTKFGLKLGVTYDELNNNENTPEFKTNAQGVSLQGVVNLGRILEFQTWTNRLNILGHTGVGVGRFKSDREQRYYDHLGTFLIGLTGEFKISPRVSLFGDFTMNNNYSQQRTWDGGPYADNTNGNSQGFDSTLYQATVGLTVALGSHAEHADWYIQDVNTQLSDLDKRVGDLETMMNDSDKDGVPDYLDAEPNTIAGVAVDSKGRTIDKNNNGVPDELESYLDQRDKGSNSSISSDLSDLINGGYINAYFDFGKDQPNAQSVSGINFLIRYLKQNPSATADVIGYADEVGDAEFNKALSARRATNVKQILVDAGIEAGRLNIIGNGEDSSVNKSSAFARQTVRRVTFMIK